VSEWIDMSTKHCYFSEHCKKNPTQRVGLVQSWPYHHFIEN